jgi:solute carrier family 45 protein 1/2/4
MLGMVVSTISEISLASPWVGSQIVGGDTPDPCLGFLNLANVPIIRLVGGGQFRKGELKSRGLFDYADTPSVCIVALAMLVLTVWITCWTQEEVEREEVFGERKSSVSLSKTKL